MFLPFKYNFSVQPATADSMRQMFPKIDHHFLHPVRSRNGLNPVKFIPADAQSGRHSKPVERFVGL
jgi:hypothetical protein